MRPAGGCPDYVLVPTPMFANGEPRYAAILGAFTVHTSVFWGCRVELYLVAENTRTGMLTWVICDYESNTISYDPRRRVLRRDDEPGRRDDDARG